MSFLLGFVYAISFLYMISSMNKLPASMESGNTTDSIKIQMYLSNTSYSARGDCWMNKADFVVYQKEDIAKIPKDAELVHIGYKMSIEDVGEIIRTRKNVRTLQFPPSVADQLHPFVSTMLDMQGIKKLVGYADRYDSKFVREAREFRQKRWGYEKIAKHLSEKAGKKLSAQIVWYWVNKRR